MENPLLLDEPLSAWEVAPLIAPVAFLMGEQGPGIGKFAFRDAPKRLLGRDYLRRRDLRKSFTRAAIARMAFAIQ